jgi:hypothetical protein
VSTLDNDHDSDGCKDDGPMNNGRGQDPDDDNDDVLDIDDVDCPKSKIADVRAGTDRDNDGCFDKEDNDSYMIKGVPDTVEAGVLLIFVVMLTVVRSAGLIGKGLNGFNGVFSIFNRGQIESTQKTGGTHIGSVDGDFSQQMLSDSTQSQTDRSQHSAPPAFDDGGPVATEMGTLLSLRILEEDELQFIAGMLKEEPRLQLRARQVVTESLRHVDSVDKIPSLLADGHEVHVVLRTDEPFHMSIHSSWFETDTETFHLIDVEAPCRIVDHATMLSCAIQSKSHQLWAADLGEHLAERVHHLEVEAETSEVLNALGSLLEPCGIRMHDPHPSMVTTQIITSEELRRHPAFVEEHIVKMQKTGLSGVYGTLVLKTGSSAQECVVLDALSAAQGSTGVVFAERSKVIKMASAELEVANLTSMRAGEALKAILKGR